jgi:glycosyltransferase involved in cell wall biosynthesis
VSSGKSLRILSIAHPAVSREAGRLRYYPFAARHSLDVHLVVPAVWKQFGRTIVADPPDDAGLTVHILPIRLPHAGPMNWYLHYYPDLRRVMRQVAPDVVHLWEEPWSIVALQAQFLKKQAALVMEIDQNILRRLPPPFEAIRKQVLRHTDHLLSRSPDATTVVRARGYAGLVTPIGYGVDQTTFFPSAGPTTAPQGNRAFRIGYVGRLVEEKGLDDALESMARNAAPVSLAIMGEGPHESRLRQRVREIGLSDRVTFQGWGRPAGVAAFLRSLDALVLLTRTTRTVREQFGRVIVEAQACGVPVIGSQSGSIPDVVGDGGWIVPERDPESLGQLLSNLAANPALVRAKRTAACKNVEARFTYDAVANALASACVAAAACKDLKR